MKKLSLTLALLSFFYLSSLFAENLKWERITGNFPDFVNAIAIDSSNNVLIGTINGLFISTDSLKSWEKETNGFPDSLDIRSIVVNSLGRIYIGTYGHGVFYREQNSDKWVQLFTETKYFNVLSIMLDSKDSLYSNVYYKIGYNEYFYVLKYAFQESKWLDFLPSERKFLAKNLNDDIFSSLHTSINLKRFNSSTKKIDWIEIPPYPNCLISNNSGIIFLGSETVYKSMNNGSSFVRCPLGIGDQIIICLKITKEDEIISGTLKSGIYYSNNNGQSWEQNNNGLTTNQINMIESDKNENILIATDSGLFRSAKTLNLPIKTAVWEDKGKYSENKVMEYGVVDLKYSENDETIFVTGDGVLKLIAPSDGKIIQQADNKIIFRNIFSLDYLWSCNKSDGNIFDGINYNEKIINTLYREPNDDRFIIGYKYDISKDTILTYYDANLKFSAQCFGISDFGFKFRNGKIHYGFSGECQWKYHETFGKLEVIDGNSNSVLKTKNCGLVFKFCFSDDGYAAFTDYNKITIWDSTLNTVTSFDCDNNISSMMFTPDSKYLLSYTKTNKFVLWDYKKGSIFRVFNENPSDLITGITFSKNSRYIITGGNSGIIHIWSINSGTIVDTIILPSADYNWKIAVSNTSNAFITGSSDGYIRLFKSDYLTSIEENQISNDEIIISPNPASDFLEISYSADINHTLKGVVEQAIQVYNVFGEKVPPRLTRSATPQEGNLRLDVSGLSPGVYFVRVGEKVGKFVKI